MLSLDEARIVAGHLKKEHSTLDFAFFEYQNTIYFSRFARNHPNEPQSSVTVLIQGIYERYPALARLLMRNRIYASNAPTEMCLGMVKVAAKRLSAPLKPAEGELPLFLKFEEVTFSQVQPSEPLQLAPPGPFNHQQDWMRLTLNLAEKAHRDKNLYQSDRLVAAILVSSEGKLLSWAINQNAKNRTLHSEVLLIQNFFRHNQKPIPEDSTLYVSLKPCKMCAGMIWTATQNPKSLRVYYEQFDSGPMANSTVFDQNSFERKRACRETPSNLSIVIEQQLALSKKKEGTS